MTNETKHTPGPWNVGKHYTSDQGVGLYDSVVHSSAGYQIANITDGLVGGNEEAKANARLIAAAPTMASRIQGAIDCLSQHKTFPADIEQAKCLLSDALNTAGIDVLPLDRNTIAKAAGEAA